MKFSRISVYTNRTSIKNRKPSAAEDKSVTVTGASLSIG